MNLRGAHVLVTGGAKRVGRAVVRAFASSGSRVMIHCRNSEEDAHALLAEIGGEKSGHSILRFDLSSPEQFAALPELLPEDLSVLVNNASVFERNLLSGESLESGKRQFDVNFWSPVELMKSFFRRSRISEICVVNLLDQAVLSDAADSFSYAISKKALAAATRCAALQFAPRMRVNGVAPGPVFAPTGLEHLGMKKTLSTLPLKRPVDADDLASGVVFSAANSSMTGSVLYIDCGQSLL